MSAPLSRRRFLFLGAAAAALAACGPAAALPSARPGHRLAASPLRGVWPRQVATAPEAVRAAYAYAARGDRLLRYIPCYCGCGSIGHRSSHDCFVAEMLADGWLVLDAHGLGCGTCVGIVNEAAAMEAAGLTAREIRTRIDARWGGAGPGTLTPLPPSDGS